MVDINHRCQNIGSAEQVEEALALWRDMGMLDFDKHTVWMLDPPPPESEVANSDEQMSSGANESEFRTIDQ